MRQSALVGLPSSLHNRTSGTRGEVGALVAHALPIFANIGDRIETGINNILLLHPPNFRTFQRHCTIFHRTRWRRSWGRRFILDYLGSPAVLQIGGELAAWSPEGKYQFLRSIMLPMMMLLSCMQHRLDCVNGLNLLWHFFFQIFSQHHLWLFSTFLFICVKDWTHQSYSKPDWNWTNPNL